MLEFNKEHKVADLSAIKSKTEKVKSAGKVVLCGITISAVLLLSGCDDSYTKNDFKRESTVVESNITSSAIIMENGNALIVDLESYKKWSKDGGANYWDTITNDRIWVLYTTSGDKLFVDFDSVKFIEGENSHEKAETIAESLISENGHITCYDEVETYGKIK